MLASTHLAVGAACGVTSSRHLPSKLFNKLVSAFFIGLVSHIVLDSFPHFEYGSDWPWLLVIIETIVVFCFVFSLKNKRTTNLIIFMSMAGGALPDLLSLSPWSWARFIHDSLHVFHGTLPFPIVSPYLQLIIALIAILVVRFKST